jgi:hypothetical protein
MWLSKRLLAQREALRYMILPLDLERRISHGDYRVNELIRARFEKDVRKTCPNFVELEADVWLD